MSHSDEGGAQGCIDRIDGADLRGGDIRHADMSGASFREVALNGVRMRGVALAGADIDGFIYGLRVNGVEVEPLIEAELNKRYPERALLQDRSISGLRTALDAFDSMWEATYERVASMPQGTVEVSVDDEWSFAQTLRHLVFCTDGWLRWGAQGRRVDVFWPAGMPHTGFAADAPGVGVDQEAAPSYEEVLEVRRGRVQEVRDFLDAITPEQASSPAEPPPWMDQSEPFVVAQCVGVVLTEEWHHHSYATRDLDLIDTRSGSST
ncbi:Pentapeptide repeat-containing protein [Promicromonospora umidemergens]|uniref:DinB-like domain-containing protein n=1 Tax=Promicromonospora umidemergens TaxID=629679 RepID=A0ABP8XWE0_9MICO|nr:DinB family protein [Promicromonospora umidemergens]MCP2286285.1 Pentapeptide repeat-containing protein [Promicromonospora umidemergens]